MDGRTEGQPGREREEPNLLRSDANDMKSHSLSLSGCLSVRLIVHWIMSRGEGGRAGERDGAGDAGAEAGAEAEAAVVVVVVRADHVTD